MKAYIDAWKNCLIWRGRTNRTDFLWYYAINFAILLIIGSFKYLPILGIVGNNTNSFSVVSIILLLVYALIQNLPSIAITIRRLHDVNKSGIYYFIACIPIIGEIWLLVLLLSKGTYGDNDYGPDPYHVEYYNEA